MCAGVRRKGVSLWCGFEIAQEKVSRKKGPARSANSRSCRVLLSPDRIAAAPAGQPIGASGTSQGTAHITAQTRASPLYNQRSRASSIRNSVVMDMIRDDMLHCCPRHSSHPLRSPFASCV